MCCIIGLIRMQSVSIIRNILKVVYRFFESNSNRELIVKQRLGKFIRDLYFEIIFRVGDLPFKSH